ncbi:hypothetical protein GGE07_006487 [Sinorhizobium terangae]|nr:hypothetical protein [Sinorhizobium terangae]
MIFLAGRGTEDDKGIGLRTCRRHSCSSRVMEVCPLQMICRMPGISQATHFNWKKKYARILPPELKRLKQLEDVNARLKKIVADLTLDREMLQASSSKSSKARSGAGGCEGYMPRLDDLDPARRGALNSIVRPTGTPAAVPGRDLLHRKVVAHPSAAFICREKAHVRRSLKSREAP